MIYYNTQLNILLRLSSRYHGKKAFGYNPGVDLPALSKSSLGPSGYRITAKTSSLISVHGNGRIGDFGFSLELPEVVEGHSMFTARATSLPRVMYTAMA